MFETDSFLGNKKLSLNQNIWHDHATMQQDVFLHFWVIFLYCLPPPFCCLLLWKTVRLHGKELQNATK